MSNIPGVYFLSERVGAPNPFGIRWTDAGKKKTKWLPSKEIRERFAKQIDRERRNGITEASKELTNEEVLEYRAIKHVLQGKDWNQIIAAGMAIQTRPDRTVAKSIDEYLADMSTRTTRGEISPDYFRHAKQKLGLFGEDFGGDQLHLVRSEELEEWLEDQGLDAPATYNNYRKHVRGLFEYFRKEVDENPFIHIATRDTTIDHVGILTPAQTQELFDYAMGTPDRRSLIGRLAFEAFAGLRFSSAQRLEKADINFEDKGVTLPRHKHKSNRRFYLESLPENLWAWVARTNDACWALTPKDYERAKSKLFKDSGVKHEHNCLRHSFCTYHIAAYGDAAKTAILLTHRNQQMLWSNYRGIATESQGKAYFQVLPKTP